MDLSRFEGTGVVQAARRGNLKPLIRFLKSDAPIDSEVRLFIAEYLEGKHRLRGRRPGSRDGRYWTNQYTAAIAYDAERYIRVFRERYGWKNKMDFRGERKSVRDVAIDLAMARFERDAGRCPVGREAVNDLLNRPKSRRL